MSPDEVTVIHQAISVVGARLPWGPPGPYISILSVTAAGAALSMCHLTTYLEKKGKKGAGLVKKPGRDGKTLNGADDGWRRKHVSDQGAHLYSIYHYPLLVFRSNICDQVQSTYIYSVCKK